MSSSTNSSTKVKIGLVFLGIVLFFVLLEAGLRAGGCVLQSVQEHRNRPALQKKGMYRIMCIGESTTAFGCAPQLEKVLNEQRIGIVFSVINKGVPGTDTTTILSQLENNLSLCSPDMVVAMMGINDGRFDVLPPRGRSERGFRWKDLKIYKLAHLIRLHWIAKTRQAMASVRKASGKASLSPTEQQLRARAQELAEKEANIAKTMGASYDRDYMARGLDHKVKGEFAQAAACFKKAIEIEPSNHEAYTALGYTDLELLDFTEMEKAFLKAISLKPLDAAVYVSAANGFNVQKKFAQAEEYFKKSCELAPREDGCKSLGYFYLEQKKLSEAEGVFKSVIERNPDDDSAYASLAVITGERGKHELAAEYFGKAEALRKRYFQSILAVNYQKLKEILCKRGIRLVCVQYPMRSVEPLKMIFARDVEGLIFVDNERTFKEAVARDGYAEYFNDIFAGDFGHCSGKGNQLLAENMKLQVTSIPAS